MRNEDLVVNMNYLDTTSTNKKILFYGLSFSREVFETILLYHKHLITKSVFLKRHCFICMNVSHYKPDSNQTYNSLFYDKFLYFYNTKSSCTVDFDDKEECSYSNRDWKHPNDESILIDRHKNDVSMYEINHNVQLYSITNAFLFQEYVYGISNTTKFILANNITHIIYTTPHLNLFYDYNSCPIKGSECDWHHHMLQNNTAVLGNYQEHLLQNKLKVFQTFKKLPSVKYIFELQSHHEYYSLKYLKSHHYQYSPSKCDRTKSCYNIKDDSIVYNKSTKLFQCAANNCRLMSNAPHTCIPGPFNKATSWIINWINTNT